jgi:hypothetical protein
VKLVALLLPPALSAVAAAAILTLQPSVDVALVIAIGLVCLVPLAARVIMGRFDIFEPIVAANVALIVMYVARPAAMLATSSQHAFKSYNITPHVRDALLISLAGAIAFQLGYGAPWATRVAARMPSGLGRWDVAMSVVFALALAALALLLFTAFLLHSGGLSLILQLIKGRNSAYDLLYRDSTAYFYGAPLLLWPASLVLFAVGLAARRRDVIVIAFILIVALGVFSGGQGSRITLLPLLLSPAVYFYLERNRRPGALAIVVATYLIFSVGVAYFREARTATARVDRTYELKQSITNPEYEYRQLLHGVDNDMFESLAVETIVVPSKIGASPFDFAYRTLAKPFPRILWRGKPLSAEEQLTRTLYPWERQRNSSSSGVIGSFYQAGLLPGVILGMLLVGCAFRIPWEYFRRSPATTSKLMLVAALMFVPITLRGGLGETLSFALFSIVPLIIAARSCRRRELRETSAFRLKHASIERS